MFEFKARLGGALGIDIQQFSGHISHFLGCFLSRPTPGFSAQFMQWRIFISTAGITANQMQR